MASPVPFADQNSDVDTAAEPLSPASKPIAYFAYMIAHPENTGSVYWGLADSITTSTGVLLVPGVLTPVPVGMVNDASAIYVIASANNQKVSYYGV